MAEPGGTSCIQTIPWPPRINLEPIIVPFSWFRRRLDGPAPRPEGFEIVDCGQTIRLEAYEASVDALLYDWDADYRRRARERALQADSTLGGSLKRLRLQRGLKRSSFRGITAKEIARIERGEVTTPAVGPWRSSRASWA